MYASPAPSRIADLAVRLRRHSDPDAFDVVELSPARADTGYYARAMRAIALATADVGPQNRPCNPVVLQRPNGLLWVYLMPAQLHAGVYPLGADVRYLVAADGRSILASRSFHNELLERGGTQPRSGADMLVAGMHTAVLDDIPGDTDVFHVLARQPEVPEYILTDAFIYTVETNGHILFGGRRKDLLGGDSTKAGVKHQDPAAGRLGALHDNSATSKVPNTVSHQSRGAVQQPIGATSRPIVPLHCSNGALHHSSGAMHWSSGALRHSSGAMHWSSGALHRSNGARHRSIGALQCPIGAMYRPHGAVQRPN